MPAPLRRLLPVLALLPLLSPALPSSVQAAPARAPAAPSPAPAAQAAPATPAWPSFLVRNEVFCQDELDFNAFARTGRFYTRGSTESCTHVTSLTRVVVLNQSGQKSEVRVVEGPLAWTVGWTNGRLPLAGTPR